MAAFNSPVLFTESVSAVTATPSVSLGAYREENGKAYRYVYNGSNSTALVGNGVIISANSGYTVMVTSVAGDFTFGVVANTQLTSATYGWVQVKGAVSINLSVGGAGGAPADLGGGVKISTAGAFVGVSTSGSGSTFGIYKVAGFATTAMVSGASGQVWLVNCAGA